MREIHKCELILSKLKCCKLNKRSNAQRSIVLMGCQFNSSSLICFSQACFSEMIQLQTDLPNQPESQVDKDMFQILSLQQQYITTISQDYSVTFSCLHSAGSLHLLPCHSVLQSLADSSHSGVLSILVPSLYPGYFRFHGSKSLHRLLQVSWFQASAQVTSGFMAQWA